MKNHGNKKRPKLSPLKIRRLLEVPTKNRIPLRDKLERTAKAKDLIEALRISKNGVTRSILCDILAERRLKMAIPVLIECLDDPDNKVKEDAAEALGKIGTQAAGEALLERFTNEGNRLPWFAIALGAIGYKPAVPALINALINSPDGVVRGGSAWSLGELRAIDAKPQLERALLIENHKYALKSIREALISLNEQDTNIKSKK